MSIKYVIPWALWTLLIMTMQDNSENPYGGYHAGWQAIGALVPCVCFLIFLIPLIFNKAAPTHEFKNVFKVNKDANKVGPTVAAEVNQNVEMKQNE